MVRFPVAAMLAPGDVCFRSVAVTKRVRGAGSQVH